MTRENRHTVTLTKRLTADDAEAYHIELPFDMPEEAEEVAVTMIVSPNGAGRCVVDLGIRDAERHRGWSGGARTTFFIGEERATPGYVPGPLTPGTWAVLLGAYRVPEGGCEVRVTVECAIAAPRWLKGDLHMHSVHSDGQYTLEQNARMMENLGCDFMALTDHNTVSQNFAYPPDAGVAVIPGMELTTNSGHANLLGVADPRVDFRARDAEQLGRSLRQARDAGCRIVLNHTHCEQCAWEFGFDVDYDYVEVWNGPWLARNERALAWWQSELAAGRRLVAVGGSDVHGPHPYVKHAMPATWVYARKRTVQEILRAIDRGHVFLSYAVDGPTLDLTCGGFIMGDEVPSALAAREPVRLTASRLREGDVVKVWSERGTERETKAGDRGSLSLEWPAEGRIFYRVEVWRYFTEADKTLMAAMSNPLYFK
ncbi:CehA/McbA family metallohydrolase [Paenibacillus alkalitolerans]|uniref:CehA/McbA family metallohydrolase n=1 Tax=Paenibacillus alkalitolerans TaxID=2799335 RepID=UPI0018F487EF|nr:CehA/McbA family metallohydrolase [Paenibacillus alkalitolerans]